MITIPEKWLLRNIGKMHNFLNKKKPDHIWIPDALWLFSLQTKLRLL